MRSTRSSFVFGLAVASSLTIPATQLWADEYDGRDVVTVAFGAGLNTAQPGNPENHHILPDAIRVEVGDVVTFLLSGLHVIRVYDDGVRLRDVKLTIPDECEVNPLPGETPLPQCSLGAPPGGVPVIPPGGLAVYYEGINPLAPAPPPPPAGPPPFAVPSTAPNRTESISFLVPGRYLVICAILPHFNDEMYAWIEVRPPRDRNFDDGFGGGHGDHNGRPRYPND
jgi:plastocyanin